MGSFMPTRLVLMLMSFFVTKVGAQSQDLYVTMLSQPSVSQLFFEIEGEPSANPSSSQDDYALRLTRSHDYLLERALGKGRYEKVYSYSYLINGFSAILSQNQVNILRNFPEVVLVEKDTRFEKKTTYTPTYIGLADGAWKEVGGENHAGEGIVIGVVDTGVDPKHPSFNDNNYPLASGYKGTCEVGFGFPQGSCNNKLVGAYHFAKGAIAAGIFNETIHYASPLDGDGHGTHTASTSAGNNGIEVLVDGLNFGFASGMAPRAHVAIYRALYPGIGGTLTDVVAAIEQAVKDKVDILSLSIGPGQPPSGSSVFVNVFDIAMLLATKAGVFVAQAAGNQGPNPLSIESFSPWICSVAASVHDRTYTNSMTLGSGKTIQGQGLAAPTSGNTMYGLVLADDVTKNASDCQDPTLFNKEMVRGKMLTCTYSLNFFYGTSTIENVASTVKNLSAAGLVMITPPELSDISRYLTPTPFAVPAIIIPNNGDSQIILEYCRSTSTATARINGGAIATYSKQGPKVAPYSSRGPGPANNQMQAADILKPNIMAPGSMIWAGWSTYGRESVAFQGKSFAIISGTSMATPHIAGIAALLKQKNSILSPAMLCSALTTTASTVDQYGKPLLAEYPSANTSLAVGPATPFDFGGGEVNATAALDPGLVFDADYQDYKMFLCSIPGAASALKNATGMSCSSTTGMPTDLNLPSITIANLVKARVFPREVTNIAGSLETYKVEIEQPAGVNVEVQPMKFTIAASAKQKLNITLTSSQTLSYPTFGSIRFSGDHGHVAFVPVSVASSST